jgi:hypothetical protein
MLPITYNTGCYRDCKNVVYGIPWIGEFNNGTEKHSDEECGCEEGYTWMGNNYV